MNESQQEPKICIKCAHYQPFSDEPLILGHPFCNHSLAKQTKIDLVSGRTRTFEYECRIMRQKGFPCDEDGKLWEIDPMPILKAMSATI